MHVSAKKRAAQADKLLAPYATKNAAAQGRRYDEQLTTARLPYERDRDRIIHSNAFRRLAGKTQVFVAGTGDHFRTRLTHTIEVAQIARSMARMLRLNEDLAEAIALAHDLGHPPFAHSGQDALDACMRRHGARFEHNEQSRRVVELLEDRYPDFPGLNLTHETLTGLRKHETPWDNRFGTRPVVPPIEGQIADIADEIAYLSHDLDDGLRAEMFTLSDVRRLALVRGTTDASNEVIINQTKKVRHSRESRNPFSASGYEGQASVREHVGLPAVRSTQCEELDPRLRGDDVYATDHPLARYQIVRMTIGYLVQQITTETERRIKRKSIRHPEDIARLRTPLVAFPARLERARAQMRSFLHRRFYTHPSIAPERKKGQRIIITLFRAFVQHPELLPSFMRTRIDNPDPVHIVVKDYIAGMTDGFALLEYKRVNSSSLRGVQ